MIVTMDAHDMLSVWQRNRCMLPGASFASKPCSIISVHGTQDRYTLLIHSISELCFVILPVRRF